MRVDGLWPEVGRTYGTGCGQRCVVRVGGLWPEMCRTCGWVVIRDDLCMGELWTEVGRTSGRVADTSGVRTSAEDNNDK